MKVGEMSRKTNVFFKHCAFFAIVSVCNARSTAYDTTSCSASIIALVADVNQRARSHKRIADDTATIALLTHTPDPNTRLLPTQNQIRMMFCCHLTKFSCALLLLLVDDEA